MLESRVADWVVKYLGSWMNITTCQLWLGSVLIPIMIEKPA